MADRRAVGVLRQVGDAARAAAPDAALLAWFAAERDEAAFAELVRRHGPVVLGVCRRVAGHPQDAEDAFQAVFLVLATKAGRLARPELLGNWLYGVAYRVARRARRAAARRRKREGQVQTPEPVAPPEPAGDLAAVIDDALAALPERFRAAVVLCDLSGLPRAEAAARLGVPEGTLSSRLNAARKKLADQLARRGVTAPAAGLAVALGGSASADVPPALARLAAAAAVAGVTGGPVPAAVKLLANEGGAAMGRLLGAVAVSAAAVGLAVGAVAAWPGPGPAERPKPPVAKKEPAEEPKPAAAAKPDAGEDRPAPRGRPRLLKAVDLAGRNELLGWSPDGKLIAVRVDGRIVDFDGRTLDAPPRYSPLPGSGSLVGFTRVKDRLALVTYKNGGGRINAPTQLQTWDLSGTKADVLAQDVASVELDPADGTPVAVLPDGKAVLAVATDRRVNPRTNNYEVAATQFRLIDAATGEVTRQVAKVGGDVSGYALTPDGRRLVVGWYSEEGKGNLTVECLTVADGRMAWGRTFDALAPGYAMANWGLNISLEHGIAVSPDGKRAAVTSAVPAPQAAEGGAAAPGPMGGPPSLGPPPPMGRPFAPRGPGFGPGPELFMTRVVLLDLATGNEAVKLEAAEGDSWVGLGFSHDGRLFVGRSDAAHGNARLRVWDARTGKAVKTWEGNADAAFAPDRPVLAILETYTAPESGGRTRGATKGSLGLWDVSALVK